MLGIHAIKMDIRKCITKDDLGLIVLTGLKNQFVIKIVTFHIKQTWTFKVQIKVKDIETFQIYTSTNVELKIIKF